MTSTPPTEAPVLVGPLSLEEYLSWGETDVRYELVDGWVVVNPMPDRRHQRVALNVGRALDAACPSGYEVFATPLDWVLRPGQPNVRQPDVVVVPIDDRPQLTEAPLLAVEILSPGGHERDLVTKRREYAAAGLRHYWVIDPEVPAIVVFGGPRLLESTRASGADPLRIDEPVGLTIVPADLVRPPE